MLPVLHDEALLRLQVLLQWFGFEHTVEPIVPQYSVHDAVLYLYTRCCLDIENLERNPMRRIWLVLIS